jgi:mannose-6-phosphate isomerase-like protein (cupin superfamily)
MTTGHLETPWTGQAANADAPVERPWGSYRVLDESAPTHKVKSIEVSPGCRLSLQSHAERSEHWFVVAGKGVVWKDDARIEVCAGVAVDIPVGTRHRIHCTSDEPLLFIEVQHGTYFGEDDIVRYDDDYGRADR